MANRYDVVPKFSIEVCLVCVPYWIDFDALQQPGDIASVGSRTIILSAIECQSWTRVDR